MGLSERLLHWFLPNRPPVVGITESALDLILETAKETHPNEMLGMLRADAVTEFDVNIGSGESTSDARIITGFNIPPKLQSNSRSAKFNPNMLPATHRRVGSVHSHPNGIVKPSNTDLNDAFTMGHIHIIVGAPYGESDWQAYSPDGSPRDLEVVSVEDPGPDVDDFYDI